ncbi:MAG: ChbG/HpnK family deacetylase, partial [Ileibacterium sp.]|nr:ChbG/HpnK family deacetylase [Ileibacterium sp.]
MNRVIVRADDLGYSRGVNLGIADAVNQGIITSVGVMTNMPETYSGLKL